MARYRNDMDDDRDYYGRDENLRRENFGGGYDDRYRVRRQFDTERRPDYSRGRFGERAEYNYDEPRYANYGGSGDRYRDENRRSSLSEGRDDWSSSNMWRDRDYQHAPERSRLRCRDIMTRDLAVATRDTTLPEIALMMKQEDTGVIPVVEYDTQGNGRTDLNPNERKYEGRNYTRGKLVGLITDRDIVVRAVADKQVRRIPITNDNGYLVGMVSMADVAIETRQDRELADAIEDISKGTSFWNRIFG
jgi:CBS domain-containing protein